MLYSGGGWFYWDIVKEERRACDGGTINVRGREFRPGDL